MHTPLQYSMAQNEEIIKNIYLQENFNDKEIISLINKRNLKYKTLSKNDMMRKTNGNFQGIILEIEDFEYKELQSI